MDPEAILQALPNALPAYAILNVMDQTEVGIIGGQIIGERQQHQGTGGEWGMGIKIVGSNKVLVSGTKISQCWGDGVYIGTTARQPYSQDVDIVDIVADSNRRQGVSLISGKNVAIIRATIRNTRGTSPQSGIDLEPNNAAEFMENIHIIDATTENNFGFGIVLGLKRLDTQHEASIFVENHRDMGSNTSFRVSVPHVRGQVTARNCVWLPKAGSPPFQKVSGLDFHINFENCSGNGHLVSP